MTELINKNSLKRKIRKLYKKEPWPQFGTTGDSKVDARESYNQAINTILDMLDDTVGVKI